MIHKLKKKFYPIKPEIEEVLSTQIAEELSSIYEGPSFQKFYCQIPRLYPKSVSKVMRNILPSFPLYLATE